MAGNEIVIFGTGEIAQIADFYFQNDSPMHVAAFTVDRQYMTAGSFLGRPVVPFEEITTSYPPESYDFFVAVSYQGLNRLRAEKVGEAKAKGYTLVSYVSSRATTFATFTCGDNCFILEDNTIQPFACIGDDVTLWSGNHIGHHATIGDHAFLASHIVVSGGVSIGEFCFVGVGATLRDHINVGASCIIGAGALLLSDVEEGGVYSPEATPRSKVPSSRVRRI